MRQAGGDTAITQGPRPAPRGLTYRLSRRDVWENNHSVSRTVIQYFTCPKAPYISRLCRVHLLKDNFRRCFYGLGWRLGPFKIMCVVIFELISHKRFSFFPTKVVFEISVGFFNYYNVGDLIYTPSNCVPGLLKPKSVRRF